MSYEMLPLQTKAGREGLFCVWKDIDWHINAIEGRLNISHTDKQENQLNS